MHKIVTGRRTGFAELRQAGGLSGYPQPRGEPPRLGREQPRLDDPLLRLRPGRRPRRRASTTHRHIVAVIGDGSMTGGMAYEALNNLGHSRRSASSSSSTTTAAATPRRSRTSPPSPTRSRSADPADTQPLDQPHRRPPVAHADRHPPQPDLRAPPAPARGAACATCRSSARRPRRRVEAFKAGGARVPAAAGVLRGARRALHRPGRRPRHRRARAGAAQRRRAVGRGPDRRPRRSPRRAAATRRPRTTTRSTCTTRRSSTRSPARRRRCRPATRRRSPRRSSRRPRPTTAIVAITAAMPGPTGLLPFEDRFPDRFFDVGIAEQHAVTAAAGMAMGGLRPVVAIYSTFLTRALDQVVYDVAPAPPARRVLPRPGRHHRRRRRRATTACYDMALLAKVPGMRVLAPSSAQELQVDAARRAEPRRRAARSRSATRAAGAHRSASTRSASASRARRRAPPTATAAVCILAVGKLVDAAEKAADALAAAGRRRHGVGRALLRPARRRR